MGEKSIKHQGPYFEKDDGLLNDNAEIIQRYITGISALLKDDEVKTILELCPIRSFRKGTILLRAGEIARESYYNLKGLVRQYHLMDGEERSTFFYTEGHSISSISSMKNKTPSRHFLSCVEDTTLSVISTEVEERLYRKFPHFIASCRESLEEELGNYQDMLATYITSKPEERYHNLMKTRPELLERVPLYMLASFLGVTPESLSRIRKRIISKS